MSSFEEYSKIFEAANEKDAAEAHRRTERLDAGVRQAMGMRPSGDLKIPLDVGAAIIPMGISEEDFDLLIASLQLFRGKIVASP